MSSPPVASRDLATIPRTALAEAAALGVALLLQDRVATVRVLQARLADPNDAEALHDFRVALRRLRSLLRALGTTLEHPVPRRIGRRLRSLARATNASRDLEVKLGWLAGQVESLRPRDRVGLRWLTQRLTAAKHAADAAAATTLVEDLAPTLDVLSERLDRKAAGAAHGDTLAQVFAVRLGALAKELGDHLGGVSGIEAQEEAHAARIAGKRVRYLLEALQGAVPEVKGLVQELKRMQDVLGEMHDADVAAHMIAEAMETASAEGGQRVADVLRASQALDTAALRRVRRRDPMPGLIALAARVQERKQRAWDQFHTAWLQVAEDRLLVPLGALIAELEAWPTPELEIERKFLLTEVPPEARTAESLEIAQGWLPGEVIHERLRQVRASDGTRWLRTVKLGSGVARQEFEETVAGTFFETLWPLTEGRRVEKRRYRVADGELVWEIDEFTDRALVLAEIELPVASMSPTPPDWLAPYIVREVTDDPAYVNLNLAR